MRQHPGGSGAVRQDEQTQPLTGHDEHGGSTLPGVWGGQMHAGARAVEASVGRHQPSQEEGVPSVWSLAGDLEEWRVLPFVLQEAAHWGITGDMRAVRKGIRRDRSPT